MLESLDTLIAFVVIMTVVSLIVTVLVQMVSSALALRGKNLANALALTFQTIDPRIGELAYGLAAQILRDPIFSDSLFAPKKRTTLVAVTDPAVQTLIAAERALIVAKDKLAKTPTHTAARSAVSDAEAAVTRAKGALPKNALPAPLAPPNREPWCFVKPAGSMTLATAVRPSEVYRLLHELSDLTPTEATLRGLPAILTETAGDLLRALSVPDQPAAEAKAKLQAVVDATNLFATDEQRKAVIDSLANFGTLVDRATTQSYDRFQRWFGSAQDRAEQWFQVHVRGVTIFFAALVAFFLQLDTIDIFHQLRSEPALVAALGKTAPEVLAHNPAAITPENPTPPDTSPSQGMLELKKNLDQTGFDLVPRASLVAGVIRGGFIFSIIWSARLSPPPCSRWARRFGSTY